MNVTLSMGKNPSDLKRGSQRAVNANPSSDDVFFLDASLCVGFSSEGVTGLKALGVRELNYKLCFLAGAIHLADTNGGFSRWPTPRPAPNPETTLNPLRNDGRDCIQK